MISRFIGRILVVLFIFPAVSFSEIPGFEMELRDSEGEPIDGAIVSLIRSDQSVAASGKTGPDGKFTFREVSPGYYSLLIRTKQYQDHQVAVVIDETGAAPMVVQLGLTPLSEEVTITASRDRVESIENIPQQVNLISNDELQQRAKTVLTQIANEEAGLSVQATSPTIGGIFIRGLTGNKVNVFLDGVRFSNSAARGGINTFLNLIDPSNLDNAEILRGPSSSQYGSDAIGGSIQLLSRNLTFSPGGAVTQSNVSFFTNTSDQGYGSVVHISYSAKNVSLFAGINGHQVNDLRAGEAKDSHNAVTRFLGVDSEVVIDERLPGTGFTQYGGIMKFAWAPAADSQLTASYIRSQQDDGKRYDQLIGGDGNLIADLRNFMLDLLYLKYDRTKFGWFDHFSANYSFNTQREERVNQGGNGNPRAAINHEYERTTVHGFQAQASKILGMRQTIAIGADFYAEGVEAPSVREDPLTHANTVRRGRVPDGAEFNHGGIFAEYFAEAVPEKLRLFGNLRYSFADYNASASDSPLVNGKPLWPDDSLDVDSLTYRAGAVWTISPGFDFVTNLSSGFRAPHITDLGTLGLTGSGFEVAFPDVEELGATIGSSAGSSAVSTGIPVEQLKPEKSQSYEFGVRFHRGKLDTDFTFFLNDVDDNIVKQALILPQGAVGTVLGDQTIIAQTPDGAVFVPASSSPVLVRVNLDDARIKGLEYTLSYQINPSWKARGIFTYIHAEDRKTGLSPNIEGGTPAPDGYIHVRYSPEKKRFWIEPYVHFALKQDRLSTLDLEDRRTGAARSVSSITSFFLNGATARGLVDAGPDGLFGTPDDFLLATGETLPEILQRVLGPGLTANSLFTELPGYTTWNVRFGFELSQNHKFLVELVNLTDKNYRGISWGLDGPGRGVYFRYNMEF